MMGRSNLFVTNNTFTTTGVSIPLSEIRMVRIKKILAWWMLLSLELWLVIRIFMILHEMNQLAPGSSKGELWAAVVVIMAVGGLSDLVRNAYCVRLILVCAQKTYKVRMRMSHAESALVQIIDALDAATTGKAVEVSRQVEGEEQAQDRQSPGEAQVQPESNDELPERHPGVSPEREFCGECGAEVAGARFCPQCGVRAGNRDAVSASPMASSSMPRGREDAAAAAPGAKQSFAKPSAVDGPRHRAANGSDGSLIPQPHNLELPFRADAVPPSFSLKTLPGHGGQNVQPVGGPAYCPSCGARAERKKFCRHCGESLYAENECVSCGAELQVGQKFCRRCGAGRA